MSIEPGKLRGLSPAEQTLWRRYRRVLSLPGGTKVSFNTRLGEGSPAPTPTTDELRADWKALTQRRADVILTFPSGGVTIIEIKPRASLGAIGQLKAYARLLAAETITGPIRLILLCGACDPETEELVKAEGIAVLIDPGD